MVPRVDSRLIIKIVIGVNVLLAIYQYFALQTASQKNTPCVVVINTSNKNNNVEIAEDEVS